MNKFFRFALLAALTMGLGISVSSCKNDDDNNNGVSQGKETTEEQAAITQKYWSVVSQLVGAAAITDDYLDKTFEPTIGEPETEGSLTRVVQVNDMKSASQRFANLVGATGIDENTPSYNYDDPDVGTLSYTRMANAEALAIVDVNIKQVPHLKRIVYRALSDENGKFGDQKAYYRFGDIVKCGSGNDTEYWICVRPAFTYEKKEDSHWVCVTHLPTENYKAVEYKNNNFYVPTKLGTDKVNMQNFAEMLWAICQPGKWHDVASNYHTDGMISFSGVPIFEDFQAKNLRYHNQYFWQNVQKGWKDLDELDVLDNLEKVLGMDWKNLQTMMGGANGTGRAYVHLLYNGYSWWTWASSPNLTLYEATYTNGDGDKRNMHNAAYCDPKKDVSGFQHTFDCREMPAKKEYYKEFWNNDDDYRFVIRHATGKELNGGQKLEPTAAISPAYAKDVYRYYAKYPNEASRYGDVAPSGPEITESTEMDADLVYTKRGFYDVGDVVEDGNGTRWFCVQPSTFGQSDQPADMQYAYFISLEKNAVGENLEHVAQSKNMAAQILFDLTNIYHEYIGNLTTPEIHQVKAVKLIEDNCYIKFDELFGVRDTLFRFKPQSQAEDLANYFISTIYLDESGQRYVLRHMYDATDYQDNGMRNWGYRFWDSYTSNLNVKMQFDDLNEQAMVNKYNEDKWVNNTWWNHVTKQKITTNMGPRKEVEPLYPISRFIYQKGRTAPAGTVPANMYREPIIPFAVKRVSDKGRASYSFEDGTAYTHVKLYSNLEDEQIDEMYDFFVKMTDAYRTGIAERTIYLNDQSPYEFHMNNRP